MKSAVQEFQDWYNQYCKEYGMFPTDWEVNQMLDNKIKPLEEKQTTDAILYALDEDGHTGDWKLQFAKGYFIKKYKNENTVSTND